MPGRMFLETVRSEGLSHLSYVLGHHGQAAVIDPRRDCEIYIEFARQHGAGITHIFETHRNEDYVIGSVELARRTGAEIFHGHQLDFEYGKPLSEGNRFELGDICLEVLETPGHTFESISLALSDTSFTDEPIAVFTGDALFIGDVGRTDFFPDRAEEVAGLLYDSIFGKLLPLGDQVILCPAHGAGSVCGAGMASREFSTLGYERAHNPSLQKTDRDEFIRMKLEEHHDQPPYFRKMEEYNLKGSAEVLGRIPTPPPLPPDRFARAMKDGMIAVDVREPEAFSGAHVPGSYCVPADMIGAFAGWFLPYDRDLGLVVDDPADVEPAVRHLIRLGYDRVAGFLAGGLHAWETDGRSYGTVPAVDARRVKQRIDGDEPFTLLDVRKITEYQQGHLPGAVHVYVGELPEHLDDLPQDRPITTFCGSGRRAILAASILKRAGFEQVENNLGSMAACREVGCPVEQST